MQRRSLLVLAGSAEARQIAQAAQQAGWDVTAWVSEPPRGMSPMPVPTVLKDFAEGDGLDAEMAGFDVVIDASHGFDGAMQHAGAASARRQGLPHIRFDRPRWRVEDPENWRTAPSVRAAMEMTQTGERVFSAAGWGSLPECGAFRGEVLMLRQTVPHNRAVPYPFVELVFGTPPFGVAHETDLFTARRVDTVLCRNLGGLPSRPKLDAALALNLRVLLIDPPALPEGVACLSDLNAVSDWLAVQ